MVDFCEELREKAHKDKELLRNEYLNSNAELQNQQEAISERIQACIQEATNLFQGLNAFEMQVMRDLTRKQETTAGHSQYQGTGRTGGQDQCPDAGDSSTGKIGAGGESAYP